MEKRVGRDVSELRRETQQLASTFPIDVDDAHRKLLGEARALLEAEGLEALRAWADELGGEQSRGMLVSAIVLYDMVRIALQDAVGRTMDPESRNLVSSWAH